MKNRIEDIRKEKGIRQEDFAKAMGVAVVGTVVLKLAGREDLMMIVSVSVCLIMVLYWISYIVLKKKYSSEK